jgi:purine-nucleoside phosphorylase
MKPEAEKQTALTLASLGHPEAALILGTGLGCMEESVNVQTSLAYEDIPGFPRSTAPAHAGKLLFGALGTTPVVAMSGRLHLYEGYSPREATFPIRVFARMGIKRLLISCAAGGLRKDLAPGSAMLITDHINFSGANPLIGPNDDTLGPRFPDMTRPYSPTLTAKARAGAQDLHIDLKEGVYAQVMGPSLETAAETRMLQRLGADAVGMSTVIEVIQAAHRGMEVLAIAAITNHNDPEDYRSTSLDEIIAHANQAGPAIAAIFKAVLQY